MNIISVPRSGQHMTERCLRYYHKLMNIKFNYCEFYHCCKCMPCKISENAFQKNHDWNVKKSKNGKGGIKIEKNNKYLFLYRSNLLQLIEANFRLHYKNKGFISDTNIKLDYNDKTILKEFKNYVKVHKKYYKNIFLKYLNKNRSNILEIEYDNYVLNFVETFKKILIFFNIPINEEYIKKTELKINIKLEHKIDENDNYYNLLNKLL
jgi:hypothetical protein